VFSRPKFSHLDPKDISRLLALIEAEATMVTAAGKLTISEHDSDNRFYECADAVAADYIVTGNLKHFKHPHKNTRIVNARQLLEILTAGQI
jgi:predicted nucleic acid-binding protein